MKGDIAMLVLLALALAPTASTAFVPGILQDTGRRLLAAAAPGTAESPQAITYPTANRRLHQEHECPWGETWIHCNSQSLCWGIGRHIPSTQCGSMDLCVSMCHTAQLNGGQCAELWNEPTQTNYYSIQYEGAVFCDPPRGKSGNSGPRRRPPGLRKLQAASPSHTLHGAAAAAAAAIAAVAVNRKTAATSPTPATAAPVQPDISGKLAPFTKRQLLQEHECYDGEFWIQCNSQPLCWGIGRSVPSTECGPAEMCESMCNTAIQNGGVCNRQWNAPSNSYYFSINHNGAVYCDPPRGGSGSNGSKRSRGLKKL